MTESDTKNDNGGAWINFYKLPDKEIYWSGSVGYSTKEIAQYNNAGDCYRIATLNIKEVLNQQAEINRLREALKEIARNKTTEEQQGNPDYVDEDGDLIGDFEYAYDEFIKIARKALNGESEE